MRLRANWQGCSFAVYILLSISNNNGFQQGIRAFGHILNYQPNPTAQAYATRDGVHQIFAKPAVAGNMVPLVRHA